MFTNQNPLLQGQAATNFGQQPVSRHASQQAGIAIFPWKCSNCWADNPQLNKHCYNCGLDRDRMVPSPQNVPRQPSPPRAQVDNRPNPFLVPQQLPTHQSLQAARQGQIPVQQSPQYMQQNSRVPSNPRMPQRRAQSPTRMFHFVDKPSAPMGFCFNLYQDGFCGTDGCALRHDIIESDPQDFVQHLRQRMAQPRLNSRRQGFVCVTCCHINSDKSKFCAQCGDNLEVIEVPQSSAVNLGPISPGSPFTKDGPTFRPDLQSPGNKAAEVQVVEQREEKHFDAKLRSLGFHVFRKTWYTARPDARLKLSSSYRLVAQTEHDSQWLLDCGEHQSLPNIKGTDHIASFELGSSVVCDAFGQVYYGAAARADSGVHNTPQEVTKDDDDDGCAQCSNISWWNQKLTDADYAEFLAQIACENLDVPPQSDIDNLSSLGDATTLFQSIHSKIERTQSFIGAFDRLYRHLWRASKRVHQKMLKLPTPEAAAQSVNESQAMGRLPFAKRQRVALDLLADIEDDVEPGQAACVKAIIGIVKDAVEKKDVIVDLSAGVLHSVPVTSDETAVLSQGSTISDIDPEQLLRMKTDIEAQRPAAVHPPGNDDAQYANMLRQQFQQLPPAKSQAIAKAPLLAPPPDKASQSVPSAQVVQVVADMAVERDGNDDTQVEQSEELPYVDGQRFPSGQLFKRHRISQKCTLYQYPESVIREVVASIRPARNRRQYERKLDKGKFVEVQRALILENLLLPPSQGMIGAQS